MSDSDLLSLYSTRLLGLAAAIPHLGRLPDAQGTARRRAPLCGSTVAVDVALADGRVSGFAQEVRACALGQAAAALLGQRVHGRTPEELRQGRDALQAMLKAGAPPPGPPWEGFEALLPARDHANRHGSILLAFEATLEAVDDAMKKAAATL
jgi:NifU-like protein involved in Fe-S cluster formation